MRRIGCECTLLSVVFSLSCMTQERTLAPVDHWQCEPLTTLKGPIDRGLPSRATVDALRLASDDEGRLALVWTRGTDWLSIITEVGPEVREAKHRATQRPEQRESQGPDAHHSGALLPAGPLS